MFNDVVRCDPITLGREVHHQAVPQNRLGKRHDVIGGNVASPLQQGPRLASQDEELNRTRSRSGLGTVGATQNYSMFSPLSKLLFTWLMMLGRLELFSILVLTSVNFWRNR